MSFHVSVDVKWLVRSSIRRFLFDYIGDTPIARADNYDFIIFNEKRMRPRLGHFLDDLGGRG